MSWLDRFRRTETRSSATDQLLAAILARASGNTPATAGATGALEAAASLYGRAFAGSTISGPAAVTRALTPSVLRTIGRELIRRGECVFAIGVDRETGLSLTPAGTWNVEGSAESWRYRVDLNGPSGTQTLDLAAASVLHFRYAVDPARPWSGLGPLQFADIAGRLSAETDAALAGESAGPMAHLIPLPVDGESPTVVSLRADIGKSKGRAFLVESVSSLAVGMDQKQRGDWRAERLGADPPEALVELRRDAEKSVLAACGVPVELAESGDGTGQREAHRRFIFGSVAPLAAIVVEELAAKLDPAIRMDFAELRASDLAGRARAFKQLTEAGVSAPAAARIAGFELEAGDVEATPADPAAAPAA